MSEVWKYFTKKDADHAKCNQCGRSSTENFNSNAADINNTANESEAMTSRLINAINQSTKTPTNWATGFKKNC